jgi:hypothetical protein
MEQRKPRKWRSRRYLDFLRSRPCCRCGLASPSEVHHLRKGADGGTGLTPSDSYGLPACNRCHGIMQRYEFDEGRTDVLSTRYLQCIKYLTEFLGSLG